jgi:hypothetical protein
MSTSSPGENSLVPAMCAFSSGLPVMIFSPAITGDMAHTTRMIETRPRSHGRLARHPKILCTVMAFFSRGVDRFILFMQFLEKVLSSLVEVETQIIYIPLPYSCQLYS